jgi:3',5'-cyclic AMP phosphodiesterase CpdA
MKYFAAISLTGALLAAVLWGQEPPPAATPPAPAFFIQASDPQFGMFTKDADFAQETANFEFFIANVNRMKPQFVVITGDLSSKAGDPAQIAEYHRIAAKLLPSIKMYNVPGNHDMETPTPESLALYRKNWGPDYYTFDWQKTRGIVLNSCLIQHPEVVPEEADRQLQWLRAELAKAKTDGMQVIVFQHIPYFLGTVDEPEQYFNIRSAVRTAYLKLFHDYAVHYIFAGHYHRNSESHDGDIDMVTTGAVGMPLGGSVSGFRIVNLETLDHPFINLANIPNQVTAASFK